MPKAPSPVQVPQNPIGKEFVSLGVLPPWADDLGQAGVPFQPRCSSLKRGLWQDQCQRRGVNIQGDVNSKRLKHCQAHRKSSIHTSYQFWSPYWNKGSANTSLSTSLSLPSKLSAFWKSRNLQQETGSMFRCEALKGREGHIKSQLFFTQNHPWC